MSTLRELFEDTVKDLYNAEKQFIKGMQKLSKASKNQNLKKAIDDHRIQSEEHTRRLEKAAEMCGFKPTGKACKAAQGLIEEATEHVEEFDAGPVLDAAIIACAQKNEHYEICSYGTIIAWAEQLGLNDVIPIFQQTLAEEEQTDDLLSQLAVQEVNAQAGSATEEAPKPGAKSTASKTSTSKTTASKTATPKGKVSVR